MLSLALKPPPLHLGVLTSYILSWTRLPNRDELRLCLRQARGGFFWWRMGFDSGAAPGIETTPSSFGG